MQQMPQVTAGHVKAKSRRQNFSKYVAPFVMAQLDEKLFKDWNNRMLAGNSAALRRGATSTGLMPMLKLLWQLMRKAYVES
jgi:hypothetical protein